MHVHVRLARLFFARKRRRKTRPFSDRATRCRHVVPKSCFFFLKTGTGDSAYFVTRDTSFVEIRRSSSRLDPPKSVKSSLRKRAAATVPVVVQCLRGGRIDATYAARRRQLPAGTGTTTGARRLAIFAIVCGKSALCRHSPTLGLAGQRTQPCWRLKRCSACATVTRAR